MPRGQVEILPLMPQRLRELRLELGWSLNDVAQRLGVTQRAVVSNWEATNQRRRIPDIENLLVLQKWYGVSMDYLLGLPGADRDSPAVKSGRRTLSERLKTLTGLEGTSPSTRARIALRVAIEVAPEAFFLERTAAALTLNTSELVQLGAGGLWAGEVIERLSAFLGVSPEWFFALDPEKSGSPSE